MIAESFKCVPEPILDIILDRQTFFFKYCAPIVLVPTYNTNSLE